MVEGAYDAGDGPDLPCDDVGGLDGLDAADAGLHDLSASGPARVAVGDDVADADDEVGGVDALTDHYLDARGGSADVNQTLFVMTVEVVDLYPLRHRFAEFILYLGLRHLPVGAEGYDNLDVLVLNPRVI